MIGLLGGSGGFIRDDVEAIGVVEAIRDDGLLGSGAIRDEGGY